MAEVVTASWVADMIRRRYIPRDNYEVSFKKDSGIVFRKFSSTSAEEIHVDPQQA